MYIYNHVPEWKALCESFKEESSPSMDLIIIIYVRQDCLDSSGNYDYPLMSHKNMIRSPRTTIHEEMIEVAEDPWHTNTKKLHYLTNHSIVGVVLG